MNGKINFSIVKEKAMLCLRGNWFKFALCMVFSTLVFMFLIPVKYFYSFIHPGIELSVLEYFRMFIATSVSESLMFTFTAAMYCVIFKSNTEEKKGIGLILKKANTVFPASVIPIVLTKIIFGFFSFLTTPAVAGFLYDYGFIAVLDYMVYSWIVMILSVAVSLLSFYVSLAFIMTPCVIADMPEISGLEAMRISRRLMKKRKFNMLMFLLSFAAWYILGMCCLGFGMLWAHAYAMTAVYIYYNECKNTEGGEIL